jgi:hypothetical protein
MITAGIHLDVPPSQYFADPAPEASLTQSIAKILIDKSPLHAWHSHPRLNKNYQHDDDRKFDIGNIAHSIMIGRGKSIVVLDGFDDWRKKAAQEARDEAAAAGKLAVLGKHFKRANDMVSAAREQLGLRGLEGFFRDGNGEVVTIWREPYMEVRDDIPDIWLRQMSDWLSPDLCEWVDYKTTDMSAAPHGMDRMMFNSGWSIQAAMAERGLDVLDTNNAGRRKFYFVVQETEYPYQLTVVQLTRGPMTMGHKQLDHAVNLWRECIRTNRWPGYPLDIVRPEWPGWAEQQWLIREVENDQRKQNAPIPSDLLMAG